MFSVRDHIVDKKLFQFGNINGKEHLSALKLTFGSQLGWLHLYRVKSKMDSEVHSWSQMVKI